MTWVRIDDGFPEHRKALAAGDQACWLFVAGLCYCARNLTDGRIPEAKVARLTGLARPAALAKRLVEAGLWERVDGGYRVHDYTDYQPTRVEVEKRRRSTRERVQKHRRNGVTNGDETPLARGCAQPRGSGQGLFTPPDGIEEDDQQEDARADRASRLSALHPKLGDVLAILEPLPDTLTEPASIDSALKANPGKDPIAAAHRVASMVHARQNRTAHTNALLMSVLQRAPDAPENDERDEWDETLERAMKGAI